MAEVEFPVDAQTSGRCSGCGMFIVVPVWPTRDGGLWRWQRETHRDCGGEFYRPVSVYGVIVMDGSRLHSHKKRWWQR